MELAREGSREGMRGIDYFNRDHPLHRLKAWAALRSRRRMYRRVLELIRPTRETRIVDVGTTPDMEVPYNNFFERWYPYPDRITACSVEDCARLERDFPGLRFRRIEGDALPFGDREFDAALSFAVLEHVGPGDRQGVFLRELARVASRFVVYTPYRYFPVEVHTLLPLMHWLPASWHRPLWRRLGLGFWAEERHLSLLSVREAKRLLPPVGPAAVRLIWSLGWPSHIEIYWRAPAP